MKRSKQLLLTALCMTGVTACAFGITACDTEKPTGHEHTYSTTWSYDDDSHYHACTDEDCTSIADDTPHDTDGEDGACSVCGYKNEQTDTPDTHEHSWGDWTVTKEPTATEEGKATRICEGEGDCDGETADKEFTLPTLDSADYSKSEDTATCSSEGKITYTYNKGGVNVSFDVATPVKADVHKYGNYTYTDGTGHYKVCAHNSDHKTAVEEHDTDGENGSCSVCGYTGPVSATLTPSNDTATVSVGGGKVATVNAFSLATGYYTFTYEGDDPITIAYSYNVLGTGTVSDTVTLCWESEHSFTAMLETKATCKMVITSEKATPFNAMIVMTFSESDPTPAPTLNLNDTTSVNATYEGKIYEFTATEEGGYKLACTDSNALIFVSDNDEPLSLPYTFTLAANEKISFLMCSKDINNPTATYNVTLSEADVHMHVWGDWTVTEANKPTLTAEGKATRTCDGEGDCDADSEDMEYVLPALDSDDYTITNNTATIESAGTGTYTYNQNGVHVSFTAETPAIDSQEFTITVTGAPAGVTVKLGKYTATTNSEGVATVKAEKEDYDVVIENDGYSYTATKVTSANPTATVKLPTYIAGNTSDHIGANGTITGAGLYTTTITAKADEEIADKYTPGERYFSLNISGEAKSYTVKILSVNTTIAPDEAGVSSFTGVGESYSIVLENGDSTMFVITSNDEDVTAGYTYKVVFEIIESEAPELGVYERPVRLENGEQSTTAVTGATDKVYFRLDYETFGKYAEITFGNSVTVYSLGLSKAGEATEITSSEVITIGEHNPAYLYAVSTGANVTLTATVHYEDGMKEQPFDVTVGAENSPEFDIENGIFEQWYKLEVEEDGTYIVKPDATHAVLEIYNDVNGEAVSTASGGASVSVRLTADTSVYIKAKSSLNQTYSFTVTEFSDADKGLSEAAPLELTVSGDYTAYETHYYKVTATENSKVVFTYNNGVESTTDRMNFWLYSDENYEKFVKVSTTNTLEILAVAGETYYIKTTVGGVPLSTFHFAINALEAHDHVITVSGAEDCSGISVKVMNGDNEVASGTTESNGTVTLNFVPDEYKIVLDNLPSGYGYFADYALTALNDEQTSYIDVKVYALADYSLTVKLPDGTGAAGITVTFTNKVTGTFTAETDANGVAKITQLPPMTTKTDGSIATGGSYAVTFELPASLSEDYTYTGTAVSLTSTAKTSEVKLTNMFAYVLTLVDGDGNALPAGIEVKLKNGTTVMATATTDADGVATFTDKVIAGEYTILIGTNAEYVTETKTSLTQAQTAVTYGVFTGVVGGAALASAAEITESTQIYNEKTAGYYKISGTGNYTVSVDGAMQIYLLYLNGTTTAYRVLAAGKTISASTNTIGLKILETDSSGIATKILFTLDSDTDYVIIGVKGTGFANVTIERSESVNIVNPATSFANLTNENCLSEGVNLVNVVDWELIVKFTAEKTTTYTIVLTNIDASDPGFTSVFLNGCGNDGWSLTDPNLIITYEKKVGNAGVGTTEILTTDAYSVMSFKITLQKDDFLIFYTAPSANSGSYYITITEEVTEVTGAARLADCYNNTAYAVTVGNTILKNTNYTMYYNFVAADTDTYIITVENNTTAEADIEYIYLNGTTNDDKVSNGKDLVGNGSNIITILDNDEYGLLSLEIQLTAGQQIVFGVYDVGLVNLTITKK